MPDAPKPITLIVAGPDFAGRKTVVNLLSELLRKENIPLTIIDTTIIDMTKRGQEDLLKIMDGKPSVLLNVTAAQFEGLKSTLQSAKRDVAILDVDSSFEKIGMRKARQVNPERCKLPGIGNKEITNIASGRVEIYSIYNNTEDEQDLAKNLEKVVDAIKSRYGKPS